MTNAVRGAVTLVAVLAAALVWLTPGFAAVPAAVQAAGEPAEQVVDLTFEGCTIRLINRYSPADGSQYARTRQVWSDTCTFGGREGTIRVRVCFKSLQDGTRVDCSDWRQPTAEEPYAEALGSGSTPRESIHYVEILGSGERFVLAAPEPATARELEKVMDVTFNGCTARLVNRYSPADGTQYAQTWQLRSEDCTFGDRDQTIRVRACLDGLPDGTPADCSDSLLPTAEQPYAEARASSPTPRGSIHHVEIRGSATTLTLSAPEPSTPEPSTPEPSTPEPSTPELSAPEPSALLPTPSPRPGAGNGLAAALAATGTALLGLGGAGFWLLRRSGSP